MTFLLTQRRNESSCDTFGSPGGLLLRYIINVIIKLKSYYHLDKPFIFYKYSLKMFCMKFQISFFFIVRKTFHQSQNKNRLINKIIVMALNFISSTQTTFIVLFFFIVFVVFFSRVFDKIIHLLKITQFFSSSTQTTTQFIPEYMYFSFLGIFFKKKILQ